MNRETALRRRSDSTEGNSVDHTDARPAREESLGCFSYSVPFHYRLTRDKIVASEQGRIECFRHE